MIRGLVHKRRFFARVRQHAVLDPIFNSAVEDWDAHLHKLTAFWSSVTLMTGSCKGDADEGPCGTPANRAGAFHAMAGVVPRHSHGGLSAGCRRAFVDRAERIAQSLQIGIAIHRGEAAF